jgi:hypothetical protein
MTALQHLEAYLATLDRRLRLFAAWRGLAASAVCALFLTLLLAYIGNRYRFASGILLPFRIVLFAGIACTVVFALARPLFRINRRRTARLAESRANDFGESLLTLTERGDPANPFTELIAEDALRTAESHPPEQFVPSPWLAGSVAAAVAAVIALVWLITAAPGYWGYGASLLWTRAPRALAPLYDIAVTPGNATVRRRTDQIISAQLKGFSAPDVILHAKYHDALKWNALPMQTQPSGNGYQLLFAGLSDSLEYYVEAAGSQSKHFTIAVKDLPAIKHLRVAIHFPAAVGLPDSVQDPGGDIRALEGSKADIRVLTDKPLQNGVLVLDNGAQVPLVPAQDSWLTATLPIKTDGSYHIAALDHGQPVRMTDNFIIEARKDEAPTVSILRPGRDTGVSPIEELPVTVTSSDDFGLRGVDLHYSVNGGPEQVKSLAKSNNTKRVEGKTLLTLEDYKLAPGDLVSFYATAKDATHESRSDIVFAKVEPFDLKFRQSQQAGGGGGAGNQDDKISERQKDIIAATWNQLKDPAKDNASLAQNARFLSDLESKLGDQAKALSERMSNRELAESSPQFQEFSKSMVQASSQMSQAVDQLKPGKWNGALSPEQKALQSLLHAEALFRDIQVSFGQQAGGGSGGGGQERDLARLFDLELDTAKNQYESGQSASSAQSDTQKQLDQQLERLKELARRQQQLANEQHSPQQQFQQKWEEEQLRRDAEELRRQLQQQLAQNSQQQSGSPGSSSQSSQSGSSSSSTSSKQSASHGMNSAQRDALRQSMDALSKAEEEMRNAASSKDASAQQRAANQLAQAQSLMRDMLKQQADNGLSDLAQKARELSASQNDLGQRIKKLYGAEGVNTARSNEDGTPAMPQMNGPGYGGFYRRRYEPTPDHPATREEKNLAAENEKLANQVQQLHDQLQKQAQALAPQQLEATRKLRKALSDAEQEEIAVRMRKNSEWLREGFGSTTWPMEDGITGAMQHLSRQLDDARQSLDKNKGQPDSQSAEEGSLGQALAQVRSLREQLQAQSQRGQSSSANPNSNRSPATKSGGQSGGQAAAQPDGQPGGQQQSGVDQLSGLRSQFGRDDHQLNSDLNDAMGALRRIDSQAGLMDARLDNNALISLERLEVELARRIGQKAGARTGAPENVPESYRDAVATYFRTLSK